MERVQRDDSQAYRTLFERYHPRVYGYLLRRTGDRGVAADLYQETFLRVYRARNSWRSDQAFRPWLFGIAVNAARDRARKVRRTPEEVELIEQRQGVHQAQETRLHLEHAIAALPDTLRDAFLLGVVEGFDHNEVAAQLDISPANARARISRARAWLRAHLGDPS